MTDNEIIKALEICCKNTNCDGCPLGYLIYQSQCTSELALKSLDLINRQRAEIEEHKSEIAILKDSNKNLHELYYTEREKVKNAKQKVIDIAKALQLAQSKAIKEFAKMLKKKARKQYRAALYRVVDTDDIDSLVKEMTEEAGHEDDS